MKLTAPPNPETVRAALDCIPPDVGHDERVRLAFAVFDGIGDAGREPWLEWAARRSKPNAAEDRATWKSCRKRGAVTVATLFGIAKDHGFRFEAVQPPAPRPTPAELKAQAAARREAEERERVATAERQRAAAIEAARLCALAQEVTDPAAVPYLVRKRVGAFGVRRLADGTLLVPLRDAAGELVNVQRIAPERPADGAPEKLFLKGGRKSGAFHLLGEPEGAAWLLICEGYATAASVHEATGRPVAVAFDCGNLAPVARVLRGRWPAVRLLFAGDDDQATKGNPGRTKAEAGARLVRGLAVFPRFLDAERDGRTDFNDLHQLAGLDAVREAIEEVIARADAERAVQAAEGSGRGKDAGRPEKAAPAGRQRAARGDGDDDGSGEGAAPHDRFRVDEAGLWFDPPDDGNGGGRPLRLCDALRVTALARDAHDTGAALLLEFDAFGKPRRWLMPLAMLAGDGTAYRAELLHQGFVTPTDAKRRALLTAYLQSRRPAELVRIVDRVGWHGRAYVLPREALGDDGGERILFQSDAPAEGTFGQRGTLVQWRERIGGLCVGNSRLIFAASCAFAAPLLAWAGGTDGGGVHLVGDSSCGKTTALRVAASVWGGRDYLQRWRSTSNGIEATAALHSDALLCLDELAQLDAREAGEVAYLLANGAGKVRAGRTGAARPRLTWRLLFLSAGEIGLAEHMGEANRRTRAGQELRMIDLPADAGAGRGLFEELHGHDSAGALAQFLTRAAEATYGTPGRAWLLHLTERTEGLPRELRRKMDAIEAQIVPEAASGQVQRVGRRFALVAVAGELATDAELTGWRAGAAIDAARRCFNAWLEARPAGIGMSEDEQMLRRARLWFQAHGHSARFPDYQRIDDDRAPQAINQAGYRREVKLDTGQGMTESRLEWLVFPEPFRAELCGGGNPRPLLHLLDRLGHLHREKRDGFTCRVQITGDSKAQVYRVKASILEGGPDE